MVEDMVEEGEEGEGKEEEEGGRRRRKGKSKTSKEEERKDDALGVRQCHAVTLLPLGVRGPLLCERT